LQLRHWQWILDTALPGDFGKVGEWLNQSEALVNADDVPTHLNEEAAAVLNQKIEDHKAFFVDLESVQAQYARACAEQGSVAARIPQQQMESMTKRLREIGPKAVVRAVHLKFLEHKVIYYNVLQNVK
jgi:nesprin-1